jgi:poly-beta-1,6-N-acetyl-D-glucosamine synthase
MERRYVIITPVKNEETLFKYTIESILKQEVKPLKWVIINDGSTDGTKALIDELQKNNPWVHAVHNEPDNKRKPGGEFILKQGFDLIDVTDYDFIVKMDGDLEFEGDYFTRLFNEFEKNPKLGIAAGRCFIREKGRLVEEKTPDFHTRGPLKTYRTKCFIDIKGIEPSLGWDTIDEMRANMLGWKTATVPGLSIIHLRKTQTASGSLKGLRNMAAASYYSGYHPLYLVARGVKNMGEKPYVIGGMTLIYEFFKNYMKRTPKVDDPSLIKFTRKQQLNRLIGKETIWK